MSTRLFNTFWVAVTAVITLGLLVCLLIGKYGLIKAFLLTCLIPLAVSIVYLRGYGISPRFEKKKDRSG